MKRFRPGFAQGEHIALTSLLRFVTLIMFAGLVAFALLATPSVARAAAATPPPPTKHFSDYAGFVSTDKAHELDVRLGQYERDSSNQILVVIYPNLPKGVVMEDYTVRTAQAWGTGGKENDNGAILFVFVAERSLRIETGYGLEGSLTDAIAHEIIESELKPRLRAGDTDGALDAAVNAMITATKGEYTGTGHTVREESSGLHVNVGNPFSLFWIFFIIVIIGSLFGKNRSYRGGRSSSGGWSSSSSSSSSSSRSSSSGSSYSGGGGSFGGGGASGKW